MTIRVKYLSEEAIEKDAEALLAVFAYARSVDLTPPVPIEDIVEKHLKLRIEFDNLHHVLGIPQEGLEPDILGAIWVDRREICIDQSLDPEERPNIEGRYRFTLAHEGGGHWRLHRAYLSSDPNQASLFADDARPAVVCRSSQSKERVEWQADYYASCLLMPRFLVVAAWQERFGNANSRILRRKNRVDVDGIDDPDIRGAMEMFERNQDDQALQDFVRPFAEQFKVSPIAMRIRLEKLGLLHREVPRQRHMAGLA
jgi:Zn-dependent peptidase ImmA (M78 family)